MLDVFQILNVNLSDSCGGLGPIVNIIKTVINIAHILIPIGLIAFGTLDLGKAVMASDDKKIKEAQGMLIKRCIYGVVVFLIPYLITLVMSLVDTAKGADTGDTTSWSACWKNPTGSGNE